MPLVVCLSRESSTSAMQTPSETLRAQDFHYLARRAYRGTERSLIIMTLTIFLLPLATLGATLFAASLLGDLPRLTWPHGWGSYGVSLPFTAVFVYFFRRWLIAAKTGYFFLNVRGGIVTAVRCPKNHVPCPGPPPDFSSDPKSDSYRRMYGGLAPETNYGSRGYWMIMISNLFFVLLCFLMALFPMVSFVFPSLRT